MYHVTFRGCRTACLLSFLGTIALCVSDAKCLGADNHWAYRPLQQSPPPAVPNAQVDIRSPIDAFVLAKLKEQGLQPLQEANRTTLVRRLYFDLIGLPPTPQQIDEFCRDTSPDAYTRLVDRLLASPHFGERWGRHWLDVARFAESITLRGTVMPEAWRYRDYVVATFNVDRPFDRFVVEQLAGDLLPAASLSERRNNLIATTFLALGNNNLEEQDKEQLRMNVVDEQLETIGKGFLAQTIGCARCHDHKFDPIPTRDYYALAGILRNTKTLEHANVSKWLELPLPVEPAQEAILKEHEAKIAAVRARLKSLQNAEQTKKNGSQQVSVQDRKRHIKERNRELKQLVENGPQRPKFMTVLEEATIGDTHIHRRGSVHSLGDAVPRGFLQAATPGVPATISGTQSGRLELGRWIADRNNPLTSRVLANRVWHWLFGAGLVRTTDNFGTTGESPSHPELLDHLARRLMEGNWSVKSLVREVVLSRTYRRSTQSDKHNLASDPENRLLWRMNRRRLDAECLLDSVLAVSGQLQTEIGGKTLQVGLRADYGYRHNSDRRALYWPVFRNALPPLFELFDFADASTPTGRRNSSTVAPQALFLMNDPWIIAQANHAARRLLALTHLTDADRIQHSFRMTLGRSPTESEWNLAREYLNIREQKSVDFTREQEWASLFQALFASIDFRYVD